jgi:ergothioneine biosynthesis protein EgtB
LNNPVLIGGKLLQRFSQVRERTLELAAPLSEADMTIQGAEFASPGKWHLAHTTWFFEEFFLKSFPGYSKKSELYHFFFNSYYEAVGARQQQGLRGLITRPSLAEVIEYRHAIDDDVMSTLANGVCPEMEAIIELGLQHEQQHQELFLTDILYNLSLNPMCPAYREAHPSRKKTPPASFSPQPIAMVAFPGGLESIGHDGDGFGFDNEFPRHQVYLPPYQLSSHLVTNADWIAFIKDGGYRNPLLWLSDGWKTAQAEGWQMPLYWIEQDCYKTMTLEGLQEIDLNAPVSHISYFEADAFARWAGKRLPTEAEWEMAARTQKITGNFADNETYRPACIDDAYEPEPLKQMYGDVWEWTASAYSAYPGFKPNPGAVGEYNGKFMNGQYVLRGGSCVTPQDHIRATYRNFFYPHQRWQFTGLRLAQDVASGNAPQDTP